MCLCLADLACDSNPLLELHLRIHGTRGLSSVMRRLIVSVSHIDSVAGA